MILHKGMKILKKQYGEVYSINPINGNICIDWGDYKSFLYKQSDFISPALFDNKKVVINAEMRIIK